MMWALTDLARFEREQAAISTLSTSEDWLDAIRWYISDGRLFVDADLHVGNQVRKVTLMYPEMFPHAPPSVVPRESEGRWSPHQYGPNGELCLAYRPDNWVSTVTGADMLASAYELLATESGVVTAEDARGNVVPSAHRTTLGQQLRRETWRFMLTATTRDAVQALDTAVSGTVKFRSTGKNVVGWLTGLDIEGASIEESGFPMDALSMWPDIRATILPVENAGPKLHDGGDDAQAIRAAVLGDVGPEDAPKDELLIFVTPTKLRAIYLWIEAGRNAAFEIPVIQLEKSQPRQDSEAARLIEQRIAVIGCGSLGSKVASMLARAGVRRFLLVDDDVFLPDNIVRNELNWESVGAHKVEALAQHLKLLGATNVNVLRQQLGGQESSGTLADVMSILSGCSLIVDASANDYAFSYVATVAKQAKIPVVWGKIFGGGFGGEIARVRPGIEPSADVARYLISQWCETRDVTPPLSVTNRYESGEPDTPMIAYDADVAVIAAHVARLAIDTALLRTPSAFESSAYLCHGSA
ncbi:ThiF family adenylyltransferase [Paraburkholderia heleia]|uniref:ThiF family adenylyltransferase n=1 Tax=Paraburkholderia heleia TaxID=634127 RepID=UPI0031E2E970